MLAKNATIFILPGDAPGDLNQRLATRLFVEPTPSQSSASGFVVASQDYGTLTRTAGHFTEFKLRTDTKILPASVINAEAKKRAEVIEQQQGYKPGRKQMKEIKDLVEQELLATSHARTHITRGWFDTSSRLLVIDTASPAKADAVLDALRNALDTLPVKAWRTNSDPEAMMTAWVRGEPPEGFTIDDRVKLRDDNGGKVSVTDRSAQSGEVLQLIDSGAVVHELAMTLEGEASFVFSSSAIKRITLPDIAPQDGEPLTEEEEANANLILSGTAVARIYEALTVELGGLVES